MPPDTAPTARRAIALAAACLILAAPLPRAAAAILGYMTPAAALTDTRLAALPASQQAAWRSYLERSHALMDADRAALQAERGQQAFPADPPEAHTAGMPLTRPDSWYATPDARHVADTIVSFQTPAGGWGKNADRSGLPRQRGQNYVNGQSYVGTIDNDATTTELRFLARVQAQGGVHARAWRDAFLKGLRYLLDAQYPNGGFPQVYPLQGGYHDAITFNDNAMLNVVEFLASVGTRQGDYAFVPAAAADAAGAAAGRGVSLILSSQVASAGQPGLWGQQHDPLTLAPAGARNFEPAALASAESAAILLFLMQQPAPSQEVLAAVHGGIACLRRSALYDLEWPRAKADTGRRTVAHPGAGPLWSRYVDLATLRPVFGDRDRSIHSDANELSLERRNGYAWFGDWPARALAAYPAWARAHPARP